MLTHIWSVLCLKTEINDENTLSIHNVLENLNISVRPNNPEAGTEGALPADIGIAYELVTFLSRDPGEAETAELKLIVVRPNGDSLSEITQTMEVPAESDRYRAIFKIQGLRVHEPGEHIFNVYLKQSGHDYRKVAAVPLKVTVAFEEF